MIYLDTHVAAWLHAARADLLSEEAVRRIEAADELRISPMVRLELQYLFEIGRVTQPATFVLDACRRDWGSVCAIHPFRPWRGPPNPRPGPAIPSTG